MPSDEDEQDMAGEDSRMLKLEWAFGFNKDIPGGVHNLTNDEKSAVLYVSGHSGVIYNYADRTQTVLQGHSNPITCCCVSEDKRWIATADAGPQSLIIVWDSLSGTPVKVFSDPHDGGVASMDMSPDALYLATVGVRSGDGVQTVALWEWTVDRTSPLYTAVAPSSKDSLTCIRFNQSDIRELVTNGSKSVVFWSWASKDLESFAPSVLENVFLKDIAGFTQSIFMPDSMQAITGTAGGDIVIWDVMQDADYETKHGGEDGVPERQAVKVVNLNNGKGILFLALQDGLVVTGGKDGFVKFYDLQFRILAWFEDLRGGAVTSVSFATPSSETVPRDPSSAFVVPNFVVGTQKSLIISVDSSCFEELEAERRRGVIIVQGFEERIVDIASHPSKPIFAVAGKSGIIQVWNHAERRLLMVRELPPHASPTCLEFDPLGRFIAVGCKDTTMRLMRWAETCDLGEIAVFHVTRKAVVENIKMSRNGTHLAFSDSSNCVGIFCNHGETDEDGNPVSVDAMPVDMGKELGKPGPGLEPSDGEPRAGWTYLGRHGSHRDSICGLHFGLTANKSVRLFSVGRDKMFVEYDLNTSSVANGIQLAGEPTKCEHEANPSTCMFHPVFPGQREEMLVTANDEYKFKLWSASGKTCRRTVVAPTYGGPITAMREVPVRSDLGIGSFGEYLAYAASRKVIGIMKMPFHGNPHTSMGLIAHAGEISGLEASFDGGHLVSAGDSSVNLWKISTADLDRAILLGGKGVQPYLSLLPGGAKGELYQEISDYFYYAQLRADGEDSAAPRNITGKVPLKEIPNIMRALGFYPSERQVMDMRSEVKYSKFSETQEEIDSINLDDFIRLYVNHRPVFGLSQDKLADAFRVLAAAAPSRKSMWADEEAVGEGDTVTYKNLKKFLENYGERMSKDELMGCLSTLLGKDKVGAIRQLDARQFSANVLSMMAPSELEKADAGEAPESKEEEGKVDDEDYFVNFNSPHK